LFFLITLILVSPLAKLTDSPHVDWESNIKDPIAILKLRNTETSKNSSVAVVLIDDKSVMNDSRLNDSGDTSRKYLADLLKKVSLQNPKVIALNISLYNLKPDKDIYLKKNIDSIAKKKKQPLILALINGRDGVETEKRLIKPSEYFYDKTSGNVKFGFSVTKPDEEKTYSSILKKSTYS